MRVSSKLLLSYLIIIGLVGAMLAIMMPRIVTRVLVEENKQALRDQAEGLARHLQTELQRGNQDALRGPLATSLLLNRLQGLLLSEQVVVVDREGTVVGVGNRAYQALLGRPFPRPQLIRETLRSGTTVSVADAPVVTRGDRKALGEIPLVAATAAIRSGKGELLGAVVAMRPVDEVRTASAQVARGLLIWVAGALLVCLVASAVVSQSIVRRLKRLGQAARTMAEGDLTVRVPVEGRDEVAELGAHFNHMAERNEALVAGLQKSESARRELVAAVSHELRTPITSIQGFAEALRDQVVRDPQQQARYLNIIAEESSRLARLIDDLFEVAKLEAGQGDFRFESLPLQGWLTAFSDRFRPRVAEHGLQLAVQLDPRVAGSQVLADPGRLDQALANLVQNATRFAPAGTAITVRVEPHSTGVRVAVHNLGPAIAPEEQQRLFHRFYQGKQGRPHKGAGLGLAIVKGIVEAHGGQVGVSSDEIAGTTFWFTLRSTA
jgi:signal transduction histidine kinase